MPDDFPEQLDELMAYLGNRHPLLPDHFESPEISLLGSSAQSAEWAAALGIPYTFADFINPEGLAYTAFYRQYFRPSVYLDAPRTSIAVSAICAESDEEAMRLSASLRMTLTMLFRGRTIPVPPVEKALEFLTGEALPFHLLPGGRRFILGSPDTVRAGIEDVAQEYGADEVFVVTNVFDHQVRRRSYELLAGAFAM
jgi:luciferase family oxidoreductase group 1